MNTTLGAQLVGFPTLGAQTWESFVDAAWFPGLRVHSRECVHLPGSWDLDIDSWESFTLVSVLRFQGFLVDSQE